ncbi:hypothetical protein QBC35DRAFT_513043 [Podospora australis]|uniref:Cross-pathway control protein 1 n=1 Tax=Podospora australis TaxID=1536484 RepID=A0AAN6X0W5_9PEZI|nr:hypothetical protein QBC35DRAFT_513043 [Podospora australis]
MTKATFPLSSRSVGSSSSDSSSLSTREKGPPKAWRSFAACSDCDENGRALGGWVMRSHSPFPASLTSVVKIPSSSFKNNIPTQPYPSALPAKVELNLSTLLHSSRSGSSPPTPAIHGLDFPVFTTDSNQSTWLPSSSSSLPAHSAHQQQQQHLSLPQQDFVLFDQPINHRLPNHRSVSQPSATGGVNTSQQYRNQPLFPQLSTSTSPSLQNSRVANIIQASGHPTTSSAFTNRFSSPTQNAQRAQQFYASSAPSSSVALNIPKQQQQPRRPPVPLFPQGTYRTQQGKMEFQGNTNQLFMFTRPAQRGSHTRSDLDLEDFTAFEGGASTAYSSPAHPPVFDLSSSVSSSGQNMGTISPQDLLIHEPFMSTPNSAALTALTSPSVYNESPDFCNDSYDVSPNFGTSEFDDMNPNTWFPLFPPSNPQPEAPKTEPAVVKPEQSPATESEDFEVASPTSGHRRKSSTSPPIRHSSIAGVNSRRRDKPLPPIIVEDPSDTVALKRARNTLAARKSRERKAQRLEELEEQIEKLKAERDHWKTLALQHGAKE